MDVNRCTDRSRWEGFVSRQDEAQFLQSWAWGEFQSSIGRIVVRSCVERDGAVIAACQGIIMRHPLGRSSLYVPRGPIIDPHLPVNAYKEAATAILGGIANEAKKAKTDFLHIDSPMVRTSPTAGVFGSVKGWGQVRTQQPGATLLLDLSKDEATLLSEQHQKTRYNLNLAKRKGVTIHQIADERSVAAFLNLSHQTAGRDGITLHPDAYYRSMLSVLQQEKMATLFVAEYQKEILVANILVHYGDTVTYLHGASSNEARNVMAPFLAQWVQMGWAKEQGAHWYDFWGIAPSTAGEHHPWAGITRFKRGFGGVERNYTEGLELPIRGFGYSLVMFGRKLRRS